MTNGQGFLAIWCEIGQDDLVDYRNWLTQEHIADRSGSPGFLGVRLFASVENERAHFFLYVTESKDVLQGGAYRELLDNPSPWTRRIMVKFGPFDRAAGTRIVKIGRGFGSHVVVSRIRAEGRTMDATQAREALGSLIQLPDTVGVRLLRTHRDTTDIPSAEKQLRRGGEGAFDYLLVVEALGAAGAQSALDRLPQALPAIVPGLQSHDGGVYKVIYGDAPYEGQVP